MNDLDPEENTRNHTESNHTGSEGPFQNISQAAITMKYLAPRRRFTAIDKIDAYHSLREKVKQYRPFIEAKMQNLLDQAEPEPTGLIQEMYEKLMAEIVRDVVMRTDMIEWERNNEFHSSPDPASEYVRALLPIPLPLSGLGVVVDVVQSGEH